MQLSASVGNKAKGGPNESKKIFHFSGDGGIVEDKPPQKIMENPDHEDTRLFLDHIL